MTVSAAEQRVTSARLRAITLSANGALALLVGAAAIVRLLVSLLRQTPIVVPDEYIYSELARSIATTGKPLIRGGNAHFPALLDPLLTAPAWLFGDVETGFRIAQAIGSVAVSLTAIPVYLLARRLGSGSRLALLLAAFALVVPDMLYASWLTAEAFAYPLALGAVAAGVAALDRPTRRSQLLFVALAGAATLARVQFVALALVYVVAVLALGVGERRVLRTVREQWLPLALFALGGAALAVVGLGYYGRATTLHMSLGAVAISAGWNLLVLVFAAGVVVVPGGVVGLVLGVVRPQTRAERAFAALSLALAGALVAEAALYGDHAHERYVFYVVPLLAIAFVLHARRGAPHRLFVGLVAAVVLTALTRAPLTTLGDKGEANSPVLIAVHWVRNHVGSAATASVIALGVAVLGLLVAVIVRRAAVALALSGVLALAALAGATDFERRQIELVRGSYLPADKSWIDDAGLGRATLLQAFGGDRARGIVQLFWNRSVDRTALLPGADPTDVFATTRIRIASDGTLIGDGAPLRGPIAVDGFGSFVRFQNARLVATGSAYRLVEPHGAARLALYFAGRFDDGWVAARARIDLWSATGRLDGTLRVPVGLPAAFGGSQLTIELPGGERRVVALPGGRRRLVTIPICAPSGSRVLLSFAKAGMVDERIVGGKAGAARFVADGGGCSGPGV